MSVRELLWMFQWTEKCLGNRKFTSCEISSGFWSCTMSDMPRNLYFAIWLLKLNYRKKVFYFALNFLPVNFYQWKSLISKNLRPPSIQFSKLTHTECGLATVIQLYIYSNFADLSNVDRSIMNQNVSIFLLVLQRQPRHSALYTLHQWTTIYQAVKCMHTNCLINVLLSKLVSWLAYYSMSNKTLCSFWNG